MSRINPVNKSWTLQIICESNYQKLFRLAPELLRIDRLSSSEALGLPKLYIRVLERSRYTMTVELTHHFQSGDSQHTEPAVRIRLYLDAKSAEVLRDASRPQVYRALQKNSAPEYVLDYKWNINYFLEKWLDHCLAQGYRFQRVASVEASLLQSDFSE